MLTMSVRTFLQYILFVRGIKLFDFNNPCFSLMKAKMSNICSSEAMARKMLSYLTAGQFCQENCYFKCKS